MTPQQELQEVAAKTGDEDAIEDKTLLLTQRESGSTPTPEQLAEFQAVFAHDHDMEFIELKEI